MRITSGFFKITAAIAVLTILVTNAAAFATAKTVDGAGGGAPPARPCFDFYGSGRTTFATFQRLSGGNIIWRLLNNGGAGADVVPYGLSATDAVTPGYFDGDNKADFNVWRRGTAANPAATYLLSPTTAPNTVVGIQWGRHDGTASASNDSAGFEGDYDGDGRTDPTVVRTIGGTYNWYILRSGSSTFSAVAFGNSATDIRLSGADYTGDGKDEIAVYRTGAGADTFLIGDTNTGALVRAQRWGEFDTDNVVIGDFVGDRRADFVVWRSFAAGANNGFWHILENGGASQFSYKFGIGNSDLAVCGDYTGDGKSDMAVWRPSNQTFYWASVSGTPTQGQQQFGAAGDTPMGALKVY
ncbi:MAG TPA: VCBS repeat-containing protein [Pyrinomonadaceae bacterium]|jgi:hypothetical protein